jgi:hypothetical protein
MTLTVSRSSQPYHSVFERNRDPNANSWTFTYAPLAQSDGHIRMVDRQERLQASSNGRDVVVGFEGRFGEPSRRDCRRSQRGVELGAFVRCYRSNNQRMLSYISKLKHILSISSGIDEFVRWRTCRANNGPGQPRRYAEGYHCGRTTNFQRMMKAPSRPETGRAVVRVYLCDRQDHFSAVE